VKGWQSQLIKYSDITNPSIFQGKWRIFEPAEIAEADRILGAGNYSKIVILPPIHPSDKAKSIRFLNGQGIILIDFSDVLCELLRHISIVSNKNRAYNDETLQILRMVAINIISVGQNGELFIERAAIDNFIRNRAATNNNCHSLNTSGSITGRYKKNKTKDYIEI